MACDALSLEGDPEAGEPLIESMMRNGRRVTVRPSLAEIRERAVDQLSRLPDPLRSLTPGAAYSVEVAPALTRLAEDVDQRLAAAPER